MKKQRFYTLLLNAGKIEDLQSKLDEELRMLQDDENEIIDVVFSSDQYKYHATIKYKF